MSIINVISEIKKWRASAKKDEKETSDLVNAYYLIGRIDAYDDVLSLLKEVIDDSA